MRDPELVSILEAAHRAERTALVRYVVEASQAEIRDDMDRRVFARYTDWSRECARTGAAIRDLLEGEGATPAEATFPIEFSQFNYLSPTYLLHHLISRMEAHVRLLDELAAGLADWPRARDLLRAAAERERLHLEAVRKLEAEKPEEAPRPPRLKGTSASRW